jgi:hypothetical protein
MGKNGLAYSFRSIKDSSVVLRDFAQRPKKRIEVPDFALAERVNASGAQRAPFAGPKRRNRIVVSEVREFPAQLRGGRLHVVWGSNGLY